MPRSDNLDSRSDEQLVAACNSGTATEAQRAFSALYERHKDYVLRIAMRFTHDSDLALDALQETFTYLLRKFPPAGDGLRLTARLTTFLYPVVRNSSITLMRKAARASGNEIDPDQLAAPQPGGDSEIASVLVGLTPDHREIVMLRFVDDMSLAEISVALQIPVGTAKSRLHLAIRNLRSQPELKKLLKD